MLKKYKPYLIAALPAVVVILGLLLLIVLTLGNRQRSLTGATYLRFETCVLNVPPDSRDKVNINRCWRIAEKSTGVKVNHFDE